MIKVSVMYPNTPGGRFDHDYYRDKHMPLVKERERTAAAPLPVRERHLSHSGHGTERLFDCPVALRSTISQLLSPL